VRAEPLDFRVRPATPSDIEALAILASKLARQHASYDPLRFQFPEPAELEFEAFLRKELASDTVGLTVAEFDGNIAGYVFVRLEPASLVDLCGPAAWIHDIYVEEDARGMTVGKALLDAAIDTARGWGADSVMLSVSPKNKRAARLFAALGFRPTMQEMRLELNGNDDGGRIQPL
jgi:ribosomal protein S18 acetylase RimI-like enzyme